MTLEAAFGAVSELDRHGGQNVERVVRKRTGLLMRRQKVISSMIGRIKELFDGDDSSGHAQRSRERSRGREPGTCDPFIERGRWQ